MPCGRKGVSKLVVELVNQLSQRYVSGQCRHCARHQYFSVILYMTRVKLVSINFQHLFFYERVFNKSENIPPQKKDTEAVSVQKICLCSLQLKSSKSSEFNFFGRKYRWSEHYFSVWCLGNSQKLLKINFQLVQYFLQI